MSLTENNSQNNDNQSVDINNPLTIFIIAVVFMIVAGGIMFYIDSQTNELRTGRSVTDSTEGVSDRLQPIAKFALKEVEKDVPLRTGKEVYEATCTTCHATGVAGAPKLGDKAAWAPFIAAGYQDMLNVAMNGRGAMPAKGGNPSLKDIEVERAMLNPVKKVVKPQPLLLTLQILQKRLPPQKRLLPQRYLFLLPPKSS